MPYTGKRGLKQFPGLTGYKILEVKGFKVGYIFKLLVLEFVPC